MRRMTNRFIEKLRGRWPLDKADIEVLRSAMAETEKLPARHDLIREGDRPGPVFVILEGWACRYKILPTGTRQILAFMMPGDCCDLNVRLLAEMDHSIQTVTVATIARIDAAKIDHIVEVHTSIARAMYVAQLIDEGTLRAWITSMGRRSSIERVAHLLCELYARARQIGLELQPQFALPLSQTLLADSLGTTPGHVNRVLKELRIGGAIALQRGHVVIADPTKLSRIAGFDDNYFHRRMRRVA